MIADKFITLSHKNIGILVALVYALTIGLFLIYYFSEWAYDDPFITYRYARNLAQGIGPVYNPGERILSTTTPLFTLLLAALFPIWSNLPSLANWIGIVSICVGGLVLWELGRVWNASLAGWTGLLLYPTFVLLLATLGSEMPLYIALCLSAFLFYARRQYKLVAVFSGLATLARPDGILVPLLLISVHLLRERRLPPANSILLFLCLTVPWYLFAWVYFGSPLPATLFVKQHQNSMAISQGFLPGLQTMASWYAGLWQYRLAAVLTLAGTILMIWQKRAYLLLFCWTILFITAYTLLGIGRYFWYYTPLVPTVIALVGLGLVALSYLGKLVDNMHNSLSWLNYLPGLAAWAILVFLTSLQIQNLWKLKDEPDSRYPIYHAIGEWLEENTPSTSTVGSLEIGIIGYYAQRHMVDFAGLIQPQVAAQLTLQTTYEDAAIWAVENYQLDYLVLRAGDFLRLENDYTAHNCQLVQDFPGSDYGFPATIAVYACQ